MRCREFEERLNDVLDQRLSPERDESLLIHAGECGLCRRMLDGQARLFAGLRRFETPSPSNRFAADVLTRAGTVTAEVASGKRTGANKRWFGFISGLVSLAALLVIAVFIGISGRQDPARPTADKQNSTPAPKDIELAKSPLPSKRSRTPAVAIVKPPAIEPPVREPDYAQYREVINSLTAQLPRAAETIDEVQQSTPAIRPLRASFSMAIGTLQRTIPNRGLKRERPPRPDSGCLGQLPAVVV